MIERDSASAIYRFATNEHFLNFYHKTVESVMKKGETWEKWHKFETNNGIVDFICPLAYTEHCFVTGHQQEAMDHLNKMAEKPWEKTFVGLLEKYGERRRAEYITKMRMGISEMDRLI